MKGEHMILNRISGRCGMEVMSLVCLIQRLLKAVVLRDCLLVWRRIFRLIVLAKRILLLEDIRLS
jgi:hypothetical protein